MSRFISSGTMTVLIVAIVLGLFGAYGVRSILTEKPAAPPPVEPPPSTITVPMASTDLPADRILAEGDVALVELTPQELLDRGLPLNEVMMAAEQVIGRRAREPIGLGEPFLTSMLYLDGAGPNLTEQLPPDYRAVSVTVSDLSTPSVLAGSFVDVVFRSDSQMSPDGMIAIPEVTVTLMAAVQVLEVTARAPDGLAVAGSTEVILAVPAANVNLLQAVEGRGRLTLVSRPAVAPPSSESPAGAGAEQLTLADVLGLIPPPPEPVPFRTVIFVRGTPRVNTFIDNRLQIAGVEDCPDCGKTPQPMTPVPDPATGRGSPQATPVPPAEAGDGSTA